MKTFILILAIVTLSFISLNAQTGSIGIGIGVPYGVLGINGEIAVHKHFSLSAGLGSTLVAGLGYAVGARAYLNPVEKKWRPRVSVHYGVNSMIAVQESSEDLPTDGKKFSGLTLGIGTLAMFGNNRKSGFDFEIAYLATTGGMQDEIDKMNASGVYEHIDMPGKIKIILGYRFGINYSKNRISPKPEVQGEENNVNLASDPTFGQPSSQAINTEMPNDVEKNLIFVGGGFNLSTSKIKDGAESLSFSFTPKIGYFINDEFALGLELGYSTSKETTPGYYEDEVYTANSWSFGPFARYYIVKKGNFSFFGHGTLGFEGEKSKTVGSSPIKYPTIFSVILAVSPALSYRLSDKVSLEAELGRFYYASSTEKPESSDQKTTTTGAGLNFGLDDITFGAIIKL